MNRNSTAIWVIVLTMMPATAAAETRMPTPGRVGPQAMPEGIAALDPPFPMPQFKRTEFPQLTVDISQQGAQPGTKGRVTKVIQDCIDEVSSAGGGTVVIPEGKWRTGRILLKSGVNLHLNEGAELHFSGQIEDYLPVIFSRYEGLEIMGLGGLIYAHQQSDIALTGRGILVGPDEGPVREARPGLTDQTVDPSVPVEKRIFDGCEGRHYFRPYFITLIECRNVLVEGVSLRNGPMWNLVPIYCEQVAIRGVTIDSRGVVNGDGVNIESSRNVLVEYCSVATGDDCFALKAGRGEDGRRARRAVENVVFRYNHALGGIGGITCGSETAGEIRNVHIHDCLFENVRFAVYFKTRRPRGGGGEKILAERIVFSATEHAIFFDMLGAPMFVGELAARLPKLALTELTPFYRDITLRRLQGTCQGYALRIKGIPESPAARVSLEAVHISGKELIYLADVQDVSIMDSTFHSESKRIDLIDAELVTFRNVVFDRNKANVTVSAAEATTKTLVIEQCQPALTYD